jgi:dihydroflavonol-4-reductase
VLVFVTGGNGFVGSSVVRALVGSGHRVRCLLRARSRTERIAHLDIERAVGDVRDAASVRAGLAGCEAVVHLASPSSWHEIESPTMDDVVIEGTRILLDAAREAGGLRVVFVSSSTAVNGTATPELHDEDSPFTLDVARFRYARAKRAAEALCRAAARAGSPVCIVNPGEIYGPHDVDRITAGNLIDFAKSVPVLVCSGGTSVAHVDDVAAGIVAAIERGRPGERYILGGDNLSIRELAALTLELLGLRRRIVLMPNWTVRALAWLGRKLRLPLPFNPHVIPYATRYWFMKNEKARRELGVSFRSARETLAPTLAWLRETGAVR